MEVPRQSFAQNAVTETVIEDGDIVRVGVVPNRIAARITVQGNVVFSELESPPAPLPRMKTRRNGSSVEVFVPREV